MITPFELSLCIIAITILWFDVFNMPMRIKAALNMPLHVFQKPIDCFFCTSFWLSLSAVLVLPLMQAAATVLITIVIAKIIEKWIYS